MCFAQSCFVILSFCQQGSTTLSSSRPPRLRPSPVVSGRLRPSRPSSWQACNSKRILFVYWRLELFVVYFIPTGCEWNVLPSACRGRTCNWLTLLTSCSAKLRGKGVSSPGRLNLLDLPMGMHGTLVHKNVARLLLGFCQQSFFSATSVFSVIFSAKVNFLCFAL